ncbi:MAG: RnfABCDGE type electron transport complex subunit G [Rikenellaceae bacterium]
MESTLKNMVIVLFAITLIASTAVGGVYTVTKAPIAAAKAAATRAALEQVLPSFDSTQESVVNVDGLDVKVHEAKKGEDFVGYAVESLTKMGYSGEFNVMVGISPEGEVINVDILSHKETPGLGSKMTNKGNSLISSIKGQNLNSFALTLKKDGGKVDALTAATITSRAYLDAVDRAFRAVKQLEGEFLEKADASTSATKTSKAVASSNENQSKGE